MPDPLPGSQLPAINDVDIWLFNEGNHTRLYDKLGARVVAGGAGVAFGVWAPNARSVSVVGDWNGWDASADPLRAQASSGIWTGVAGGAGKGQVYKFHIRSKAGGYEVDKADPFALMAEQPPHTGSVVWDLDYEWSDRQWMEGRGARNALDAPMSIYEVHTGSWRHAPGEHRSLNYRELAQPLADYVADLGFTHVELLPVTEHPFYGSWGYQTTGYFAPTSRFGTPQDFMHLVDVLHGHGIGVLLDWVPSHFPSDQHGLGYFDGTHLYEHADPRKGLHPDWGSLIFNYDRHEVRSFLMSSAHFWLEHYHIDGLRLDAVASMLYLDYSRQPGDWIPNEHGGNENLGALRFLKRLNEVVYADFPDVQTVAEESTAWPMVSRPTSVGGLGFGLKWDMGWMHDTLKYMERDPVHRRHHHDELTFRMVYAWNENFCLPLSHDEVVHGKGSLLHKMPGDRWQQFANLRLLFGYQYAQPGKQLMFMGSELAPDDEWDFDSPLPWHLLGDSAHAGVHSWVRRLNELHACEAALHEVDFEPAGFEWVEPGDAATSVLSFLRWPRSVGPGSDQDDTAPFDRDPASAGYDPHPRVRRRPVLVVCNFTPVPRDGYRIGVPWPGRWDELANSDALEYGGSGRGNLGGTQASDIPSHDRAHSLELSVPPLAILLLAPAPGAP